MRYLDFKQKLSGFQIFSLTDIQSFEPDFNLVQLSQWQEKGYIKKIIKGKYIFSDLEINEEVLFLISNELLSPSYISLEMALSWYGVIPEGVYTITAVTTVRTIDYKTDIGNFSYNHLKNNAFFGDKLVKIQGTEREYRIASLEKSIVDLLYFNDEINSDEDISGLRFNQEVLDKEVDYELLATYADAMDNMQLSRRVNTLIKYFEHDQT